MLIIHPKSKYPKTPLPSPIMIIMYKKNKCNECNRKREEIYFAGTRS